MFAYTLSDRLTDSLRHAYRCSRGSSTDRAVRAVLALQDTRDARRDPSAWLDALQRFVTEVSACAD